MGWKISEVTDEETEAQRVHGRAQGHTAKGHSPPECRSFWQGLAFHPAWDETSLNPNSSAVLLPVRVPGGDGTRPR